ncbi:ABC transporter permease [Faecalicatena contorta]|uniref:Monosaccharide ABC transporter membrane protein, CUT2 family n=1 Tax=Faecalicatena contorta TaxID=39482 RepID=A0A315ZQD1_9FIRM|nr:ABC transporter permease [Faecalicatena contorta]PWJ47781.1 monosaccharide ABC transporter membrane protein (CUT2 family) [Faecalicatena contorta]SUQ15775.1 monosaccharide ABC transporter membrane protein, CUT2 family [Faecalicatena contorta]
MQFKSKKKIDLYQHMVYIIFVIVLIFFAIWLGPSFFSMSNLLNITRQTAMVSVMAVAMTYVIASGQIDLSIGAVVALSSLIAAWLLERTDNILLALACSLGVGLIVGIVNGLLVTYLKIPAFLATLGTQSIIRGSAMWLTATKAITIRNTTFNNIFGMGTLAGIPIVFIWTALALLIGHIALRYMSYGKKVLSIGGNETSAFYSGINIIRIKITVFAVMGLSAAFAGIIYSARMQTARYTYGEGDEMNVIASVVLGGTSMAGGSGNIIEAVVGSLLLGIINNGLIIGGLDASQQQVVRGCIIILAVALSTFNTKKQS